jgi:hypothetical protein
MSAANFVESFAKLAGIWPDKFISVSEYLEEPKVVSANEAQTKGILIVHSMGAKGKGGVTIAYRKTSEHKNCRMVEVATAYCSPQDIFSKKIGTRTALTNFLMGKTIMIPARRKDNDDAIVLTLRNIFWNNLQPFNLEPWALDW